MVDVDGLHGWLHGHYGYIAIDDSRFEIFHY